MADQARPAAPRWVRCLAGCDAGWRDDEEPSCICDDDERWVDAGPVDGATTPLRLDAHERFEQAVGDANRYVARVRHLHAEHLATCEACIAGVPCEVAQQRQEVLDAVD